MTINGWTGDRSYKVDTAADFPTFTGKKLDAEHDAATQALGSAWRTPAVQDFVDLFSACGVSYKTTCFYWTSERVNDYNSDTWNEGVYMTISQQLIAFGRTIRPVSD